MIINFKMKQLVYTVCMFNGNSVRIKVSYTTMLCIRVTFPFTFPKCGVFPPYSHCGNKISSLSTVRVF